MSFARLLAFCRRAVSPIISVILIIAIVVAAIGIIMAYYGPAITNMREGSLAKEIAGVMCVLDDNVRACIVDGKGSSRITHFEYFKGMMRIRNNFSEVAIEVWNITSTSTRLIVNISFRLGGFEFELPTASQVVAENGTRYIKADPSNFVNDTSFTKDIGRVTMHKYGSLFIRLDYRVRVFNWTEDLTYRILFRIVNVTRTSHVVSLGPPRADVYTENLDTLSYIHYSSASTHMDCTILIIAKYRAYWFRNSVVEYPLRVRVPAGSAVRIETLTTIIGSELV